MPVRLRLTLLYTGLFAAALLLLAGLLHLLFTRSLLAQLDSRLTAEGQGTARLLAHALQTWRPADPLWKGWPPKLAVSPIFLRTSAKWMPYPALLRMTFATSTRLATSRPVPNHKADSATCA